ncbi:unnamed protein product [Cyberlindnera jadinii]|uniref:Uncharacterized protein n=1 Tax=Cyberlindnera jadinii (strain ATCC 18201 / CBS 1600 / BCRC 20928 / JCM 3617 / NBRC 0987 / NRRL Y-1542) TaxID=983966 RepID=A0A0H5C786_CYBJN|nr:unnamed protein product [Cyberlindnera jadinii]
MIILNRCIFSCPQCICLCRAQACTHTQVSGLLSLNAVVLTVNGFASAQSVRPDIYRLSIKSVPKIVSTLLHIDTMEDELLFHRDLGVDPTRDIGNSVVVLDPNTEVDIAKREELTGRGKQRSRYNDRHRTQCSAHPLHDFSVESNRCRCKDTHSPAFVVRTFTKSSHNTLGASRDDSGSFQAQEPNGSQYLTTVGAVKAETKPRLIPGNLAPGSGQLASNRKSFLAFPEELAFGMKSDVVSFELDPAFVNDSNANVQEQLPTVDKDWRITVKADIT